MVQILRPTLNDIPLLTEIARKSFLESHGHSASPADIENYMEGKLTEAAFAAELLDERNIFHLLYHNGRPAGYSKIILDFPSENIPEPHITKLERLYLLETFHGLRLGYQLFDINVQISKQANQAGIWLFTWTENHRALTFYQRMGFQVVGRSDFKISETHYNPNHIMWLAY